MPRDGNSRAAVIAGTTEGREAAAALLTQSFEVTVYVATQLGSAVLQDVAGIENARILIGRKNAAAFAQSFACLQPAFVVDASHPFADVVTKNVREACRQLSIPCVRFERPASEMSPAEEVLLREGRCLHVADTREAAAVLNQTEGNLLFTTGSQTISDYARYVKNFSERAYVRVLDTPAARQACADSGLAGPHVITARPPFAETENLGLIRRYHIRVLITKASGRAGGLDQKLGSVQKAGITAVIIDRPREEQMETVGNVRELLTWAAQIGGGV